MELYKAISLIEKGVSKTSAPQTWADLGAGNGLFTQALAMLLPEKSLIYAVDKNKRHLDSIKPPASVILKKIHLDFIDQTLKTELLDGILMANSFHYVAEKEIFTIGLKKILKQPAQLILVEYDMDIANAWVPYPISFEALKKFAKKAGFTQVSKLGSEPSVYSDRSIYSAKLTS